MTRIALYVAIALFTVGMATWLADGAADYYPQERAIMNTTDFDPTDPHDGFYWVRRKDGRYLLVKVDDDNGKKSVNFFNGGGREGLRTFRERFVFVKYIEPPSE